MAQNYKDTLNLPKTEFPMKASLTSREPEILKLWEETRLYQQIQKARVESPSSFLVSLERKGGVAKAKGPIAGK